MYYIKSKNPQGKWYPRSVTQGKPVSTKTIAKRLAGYTGKDIKAVDTPEQVTSKMFAGVRMRFVPES